ncbi:MAG: hypothetical protein ACKV22_22770, partial [Bryobacteraceae bacterium]
AKSLVDVAERVVGRLARSPGVEKLLKRPLLIFLHLLTVGGCGPFFDSFCNPMEGTSVPRRLTKKTTAG